MSFILSPNMNLSIPSVGTEPGPNYAFDINASLSLIDQHDHSPGRGIQVTPAGLNINSDLSLQGNSLTNALSLVLSPQGSASTTLYALSAAPGGGTGVNDLYYTDGTGTAVQITKNGIVNVTAASIPGESYSTGTFFWTQTQDGLPTTPANFDIGSITLRPNVALTTNGVILGPPSAISSQYNINLPLLPVSTSFMAIDNSGNITTPATTAFIIPSNAGTSGQYLRQSGGGTPLYQDSNSNIQVKTANYLVSSADDMILCSGNTFNVTLPSASGIIGKTFILKKTDNNLTNVISSPHGVETIDGYTTYSLRTFNETLEIASDGTNWQIIDHKTNTDWTSDGTITIAATTTPPTKGAAAQDNVRWMRQGKYAIIRDLYVQAAGGATGSGDYLVTMPSGMLMDSTVISFYTGSIGSALTQIQSAYEASLQLSASGLLTGSTSLILVEATAYSNTQFRLTTANIPQASFNNFGSGGTTFASALAFNFTITVPILNWRP